MTQTNPFHVGEVEGEVESRGFREGEAVEVLQIGVIAGRRE